MTNGNQDNNSRKGPFYILSVREDLVELGRSTGIASSLRSSQ